MKKNFKNIKIFGDIMLDQWISGNFNRISPEAPVSILESKNYYHNLGGAGNVAVNLDSLKVPLKLYGSVGNDFINSN